jgi:general secretion pathway protein K
MRPSRGFALLAVLWVIVALVALGVGISIVARQALGSARNRIELTRAEWRAEACMERLRADVGEYLQTPHTDTKGLSGWSALDQLASALDLQKDGCAISIQVAGAKLDVNAVDAETMTSLLSHIGIPAPRRDSMVAALMDWRDADDDAREEGAERAWYARNGRIAPRNGAIADMRELRRVRGFETLALDSVLDVEPGRIDLNHASLAVIGSLPGISEEAVSRISQLRDDHMSVADLSTFAGQLSPGARQQLLANYAELTRATVTEPDAWIAVARVEAGAPAVGAVVEVRLVRAGTRAAIVRRRSWIL